MTLSKKARKEMTDHICHTYDLLEGMRTNINSSAFRNYTKKMSDEEFDKYVSSILYDPDKKKHLYFEVEYFENESSWQEVEAAADYTGTVLFDYLCFPEYSKNGQVVYTVQKVHIIHTNMRRVQQLLHKKNNIPTDIDNRNPKTGQVTNDSKAASVSGVEMFSLICHGTKKVMKEYFGPRAGDRVQEEEMMHQIATTGHFSLDELTTKRSNRTALNTANVILLGACLESDLVAPNMLLTRTLEKQYDEANSLRR